MSKKWTKEEDVTLFHSIASFSSRKEAFTDASRQLGRTYQACQSRWYKLKGNTKKEPVETLVKKPSLWRRFINLFKKQ